MPKKSGNTFTIGQLVWAKMKGFPFWPSKVTDPEENPKLKRSRSKKNTFCVRFFGTGDYASISVDEMRPYFAFKEKLSTSSKKPNFIQGLQEIETFISENPSVKEYEANVEINDEDAYREWLKDTKDDDVASDLSEEVDAPIHPLKKPKLDMPKLQANRRTSAPSETIPSTAAKAASTNGLPVVGMSLSSQALSSSPRRGLKVEPKKIGFIGIGTMGSVLAKRLINAGHHLVLCNRSPKDEDAFQPGRFVESPSDLIDECDIIVSCLSDSEAVRDVMFGYHGISERFTAGKSYIELSTVNLSTLMEVQDLVVSRGGRYLEAPMSGTLKEANEGKMIFLCAGDRQLFDEMESFFQPIGRRVLFLGSVGSGMKVRLGLQMLNGIIVAGVAETIGVLDRCSVSIEDFADILELSGTNCQLVKNTVKEILDGVFMPADFQLGLMQKEIQSGIHLANERLSQPTMLACIASNLFLLAKSKGEEKSSCAAVYRVVHDGSTSK